MASQRGDCTCPLCRRHLTDVAIPHARDRKYGIGVNFEIRDCPHCRLGVTYPTLEGPELARHYPPDYDPWHRPRSSVLAVGMHLLTLIRVARPPYAKFKSRGAGTLLDVGCGSGELAAVFQSVGWAACGLDISPAAVETARAAGIDAYQGTLTTAPWEDGTFDLIVMNHSLEHMPNPMAALGHARGLLKTGGSLVVIVPNWQSWQRRFFGTYWLHLDVPRHLVHYSAHSLHFAAKNAGFRRGRTRGFVSAISLPITLYAWLSRSDALRGRRFQALLLASALCYPVSWSIGRPLGGDCVYLVAEA